MSPNPSSAAPPRVQVFSTTYCGWCRSAEDLLRRNGIAFDAVDVTNDSAGRRALVERAHGRRTVPVVFIDGRAIGGFEELARMLKSGQLDALKTNTPRAA